MLFYTCMYLLRRRRKTGTERERGREGREREREGERERAAARGDVREGGAKVKRGESSM